MAGALSVKTRSAVDAGVCRQCGNALKPEKKFCSRCGAAVAPGASAEAKKSSITQTDTGLQSAGAACPRCGANNLDDARFCLTCGEPLLGRLPALRQFLFHRPWSRDGSTESANSTGAGQKTASNKSRAAMAALVAMLAIGATTGLLMLRKRNRQTPVVLASQRQPAAPLLAPTAAGAARTPDAPGASPQSAAPVELVASRSTDGHDKNGKTPAKQRPDPANDSASSSVPTPDPFSPPPSSPAVVAAVQSANQTPPPPSATTASPAFTTPRLAPEALPEIALSRSRGDQGSLLKTIPAPPVQVASPAPPTPTRIHVSGDVEAAKLIYSPKPDYPPIAKAAQIRGSVRLAAFIGEDGGVRDVKVVAGNGLLAHAAVEAVKQWRYQPTLLNGKPVQVDTDIDITFAY
jgi:TonB family protein